MQVAIDRSLDEPVYGQVARQVRALVATGRLPPGAALPSVRTLAGDLGVNLNTVARAYRQLEAEGFVQLRSRARAVVAAPRGRPDVAVRRELVGELRAVLARLRQAGCTRWDLERLVRLELERLGDAAASPEE